VSWRGRENTCHSEQSLVCKWFGSHHLTISLLFQGNKWTVSFSDLILRSLPFRQHLDLYNIIEGNPETAPDSRMTTDVETSLRISDREIGEENYGI
jgi:hypothetical protein